MKMNAPDRIYRSYFYDSASEVYQSQPAEDADTCTEYINKQSLVSFIESLEKEQPQGLNEAAEEYADRENPTCPCGECLVKTFKAGAKWMAEQGISYEDVIQWDEDGGLALLDAPYYKIDLNQFAEKCDKVIVQIRKKED